MVKAMRARTLAISFIIGAFSTLAPHAAFAAGHLYAINSSSGGECSAIGTWNPGTRTCTLTRDVDGAIEIDSSVITLDGAGHLFTIDPPDASGLGIHINGQDNVTVMNLMIHGNG